MKRLIAKIKLLLLSKKDRQEKRLYRKFEIHFNRAETLYKEVKLDMAKFCQTSNSFRAE